MVKSDRRQPNEARNQLIVRWIPTRDDLRTDLEQLCAAMDEDIAAGCRPMMVVGTGGSAARLADAPEDLHDLELADSVA